MNKETVRAYCVYDNGHQRFYRITKKFTKHFRFGKEVDSLEELKKERERIKPEYQHLIPLDGYELICVSDAHTHDERLCFAAISDEEIGHSRLSIQVDGVHTMMIHGGDSRRMYSDLVYVRRLAKINGYQLINEKVEVGNEE